MITGELRNRIDAVWNAFWTGGISNPLEIIEQITYLLFLRRLDDRQKRAEHRARMTKQPIVDPVYSPDQYRLRWSEFREADADGMYKLVSTDVFDFLRNLGGLDSSYAVHMKDARFTIPTPALLSRVVDMLNDIELDDRDTNGDLYEYMLGKLAASKQNGQFRTPRHIVQLMVDMMAPKPGEKICDPACGTAGFLMTASEHVRKHHEEALLDTQNRYFFHNHMFHGYDFDNVMLRIGSMNMQMHGVEGADISYRDSLSQGAGDDDGEYDLVLANPPFAGSLDYSTTAKELLAEVKTKKTELLFLALFLRLVKRGGRAAVIVPDGVLFGSSSAHKKIRRTLVEDHKLDAVVKLPSGVFKPYAGVSTAILFFTKTDAGGTDHVWFYDVRADGYSLDDKRNPVEATDLADVLSRWGERDGVERERTRSEQSFCVPKADVVAQDYVLAPSRYQELSQIQVSYRLPSDILDDLAALNIDMQSSLHTLSELISTSERLSN